MMKPSKSKSSLDSMSRKSVDRDIDVNLPGFQEMRGTVDSTTAVTGHMRLTGQNLNSYNDQQRGRMTFGGGQAAAAVNRNSLVNPNGGLKRTGSATNDIRKHDRHFKPYRSTTTSKDRGSSSRNRRAENALVMRALPNLIN